VEKTSVTILRYINIQDHLLVKHVPLKTIFERHHPFNITEINIKSDSEYDINGRAKIVVFNNYCALHHQPWDEVDRNEKIYINGHEFWNQTGDRGSIGLDERDIIEVRFKEPRKDTLTYIVLVITKFDTQNPDS
jgi:hypothetical protein